MERYHYDANNQRIRMDEYNMEGVQKTYTEYTCNELDYRKIALRSFARKKE